MRVIQISCDLNKPLVALDGAPVADIHTGQETSVCRQENYTADRARLVDYQPDRYLITISLLIGAPVTRLDYTI